MEEKTDLDDLLKQILTQKRNKKLVMKELHKYFAERRELFEEICGLNRLAVIDVNGNRLLVLHDLYSEKEFDISVDLETYPPNELYEIIIDDFKDRLKVYTKKYSVGYYLWKLLKGESNG